MNTIPHPDENYNPPEWRVRLAYTILAAATAGVMMFYVIPLPR